MIGSSNDDCHNYENLFLLLAKRHASESEFLITASSLEAAKLAEVNSSASMSSTGQPDCSSNTIGHHLISRFQSNCTLEGSLLESLC